MSDRAETEMSWVRRWRLESLRIAVSLVVLVIAALLAVRPPADWEAFLFRLANDLPRQAEWAWWPLQQAGMALAVPVAAVILLFVVRHWRPPLTLVAGGIVFGWAGAKLIKQLIGRGRPAELLADVQLGFDVPLVGLGFPSGHVVVAFTVVPVFSPYVPRWLRWTLYAVAVGVGFSRVYMGAHMPLDVIGGAAYGLIVSSIVNLVSGIRADRAKPEAIVEGYVGALGSASDV